MMMESSLIPTWRASIGGSEIYSSTSWAVYMKSDLPEMETSLHPSTG